MFGQYSWLTTVNRESSLQNIVKTNHITFFTFLVATVHKSGPVYTYINMHMCDYIDLPIYNIYIYNLSFDINRPLIKRACHCEHMKFAVNVGLNTQNRVTFQT